MGCSAGVWYVTVCKAPQTFQAVMIAIPRPFRDFALVYVDDILVYTRRPEAGFWHILV